MFKSFPNTGTSRSLSHRGRVASAAVAVAVAGVMAGYAPSAYAGTDGQQIALNFNYSNCGTTYGPPEDVRITGQNQSGQPVTWQGASGYIFPPNAYTLNWWWRGVVTVTWRKAHTNQYYQTSAFVPQWDDSSFEMWPNTVLVDCHGSLRQVSTRAIVYGTAGTIWACGGFRDGGGLTDTISYTGYDEYWSQTNFTYGIAGAGTTPAIITNRVTVPNC